MHPGAIVAGRWEILEPLGAGGMGDVYRARHRVSQAEAAVKILRSRRVKDAARFEREASAPAQIGHPGITRVFDAGVDRESGSLYIATELLHGATLSERLNVDGLRWIRALLAPLAAAHAVGLIHRDLKPDNVFIHRGPAGEEVKILDFGLVRPLDGPGPTGSGEAMGTPQYMAPEQIASARDVTPAADVWAVGVMLYEALTGGRPFAADSLVSLAVDIRTKPHVPLGIARPDTPPALASLVDRCLDKHPSRRPPDAAALARELDALGASIAPAPAALAVDGRAATVASDIVARPTPPHPAVPEAPAGAPKRRSPLLALGCAAAGALVAVLSVVGGVVAWRQLREPDPLRLSGPGFSVDVPADFEPIPSDRAGYLAHRGEPHDPSEGGARTQVYVQRVPYAGTVEQLAVGGAQRGVDNGGTIERNVPATLGGAAGREIEIAYPHIEASYVQSQRFVVLPSGHAWIVGCSGQQSRFDEIRPTCRAIYDSFRFDDEPSGRAGRE